MLFGKTPLKAHNDYISKHLGGMASWAPPGYAYALPLPSEIFCVRHCPKDSSITGY